MNTVQYHRQSHVLQPYPSRAKSIIFEIQDSVIITWRRYNQFHERDFCRFMREVAKQARELQQEIDISLSGLTNSMSSDEKQPKVEIKTFENTKKRESKTSRSRHTKEVKY